MFCKQCGTVIPEGRTSCPMCGKSVEQGGADVQNTSGLMQMPRSGGSGGNEKPRKELSLPILIGAIAVILGVIVIAVLIF